MMIFGLAVGQYTRRGPIGALGMPMMKKKKSRSSLLFFAINACWCSDTDTLAACM